MTAILRFPVLVLAAGVEQLRRLPGGRALGVAVKWLARLMLLGAVVLTLLWAGEASPQRMSLADLAAGKLGSLQSWIIVSGDLADEQGSTDFLHLYRLTDPAAPNAYLVIRSRPELPLGRTTVSGRIVGGREGVPPGYAWSAPLDADAHLASELPPPWTAIGLAAAAVLLIVARRTRYPVFAGEAPGDARPATSALRVTVRSDTGARGRAAAPGTLSFSGTDPGAADLALAGERRMPVRLHSAFTAVDAGVVHLLAGSEPALRVRSENDDLTLTFGSARERDSAFAALGAAAQGQRAARAVGNASPSRTSG
ncbi:MAG TPA: hypothetical protein VL749_01350 [Patescibacteria group bacterium]|nr:hypothetical protein [Patescibacteria group bacterium]